jgi:hypothetical protein
MKPSQRRRLRRIASTHSDGLGMLMLAIFIIVSIGIVVIGGTQ